MILDRILEGLEADGATTTDYPDYNNTFPSIIGELLERDLLRCQIMGMQFKWTNNRIPTFRLPSLLPPN